MWLLTAYFLINSYVLGVSKMSRQDYVKIAQALNLTMPIPFSKEHVWYATCQNVADALQAENKLFDAKKFIKACMQDPV